MLVILDKGGIMTIAKIKDDINSQKGNVLRVICNGSRNRVEEYKGKITEIYNSIFIVKLDDTKNKSFCYSDVLTNNIQLYFDNM